MPIWIQYDLDHPDELIVCDDAEVLFGPTLSRFACESFVSGFLHGMRYAYTMSGDPIAIREAIDALEAK